MNKQEKLLAQKTLAARQMKWEKKCPGTAYNPANSMRRSTSSLPDVKSASQTFSGSASTSSFKPFSGTEGAHMDMQRTENESTSNFEEQQQTGSGAGGAYSPLVNTLAQRSMTAVGALRKMHHRTAIEVNKAASAGTLTFGEDYFIPKKKLVRPDGAALSDVYESKKNDTWSTILKSQVREATQKEKDDARKKYEADQRFGKVLKAQVHANSQRRDVNKDIDEHYAQMVEESSRKADEVQQKRKADAIRRHKQFISNAVEDMELKRKQTEEFLRSEIEASTLMIVAAKKKAAEEEERKQEQKALAKIEQERRFQENLESLRRKEEQKLRMQEEEKRMAREAELKAIREAEKREAALNNKMVRSTEGPVHKINRMIVDEHNARVNNFHETNQMQPNMLTKQLQSSEEAAFKRATADSKFLCKDWDYCIHMREVRKQEEQKFVEKCGRDMKEIIRKTLEAEEKRREDHRKSCLKYQHDLDHQLKDLRARSLQSLTETMNARERALNKGLIEKALGK